MALAVLFASLLAACPRHPAAPRSGSAGSSLPDPGDALYQIGTLAAFAAGLFEGPTRYGDLLRHGDLGLGALSPLEGEVIILDGEVWHADVDGALRRLPDDARTPFAMIKRFAPEQRLRLPASASLKELVQALDARVGAPGQFHALRLDAVFERLTLRSVPRQSRPYPGLDAVLAQQRIHERERIAGTLVGFRMPAHVAGTNVPGWHLHFVDRERRLGGHVLDLRLGPATAALDSSRSLLLMLPDDPALNTAPSAAGDRIDLHGASPAGAANAATSEDTEPLPGFLAGLDTCAAGTARGVARPGGRAFRGSRDCRLREHLHMAVPGEPRRVRTPVDKFPGNRAGVEHLWVSSRGTANGRPFSIRGSPE
jgi:acetolactate decarboxylase